MNIYQPIQPRWYQREAVQAIYDYFAHNSGNPIVALPTGSGKSAVIAWFVQSVLQQWPNQRFMILTHVKELIKNNAEKMQEIWPAAPLGIYSAGLQQRDIYAPITFAGVQSVAKKIDLFGHRDLVLVDECHLISPKDNTRYQTVLNHLRTINPYLKVIGLSATWWRMGQGSLTDGDARIFTDICYNLTDMDGFARLIYEGYLSRLIPQKTKTELDLQGVGMSGGEYNLGQLQNAVNTTDINQAVLRELVHYGQNRRCWLLFCSGIEHSEDCAAILNGWGIPTVAVHSKLSDAERDARIVAFKTGQARAMTNNNIFTTGHDHPPIDLIGMLRPTLSTSLWVQMLGRGMRPSPLTQKQNCLVLDYAKNTKNLGPVDDPMIPRPKGKGLPGEVPIKICKHCGAYNHTRVMICIQCGAPFEQEQKLTTTVSTAPLLRSEAPEIERFKVDRIYYSIHEKKDTGNLSLKVVYQCGLRSFYEYVPLEHPTPIVRHRAREWWRARSYLQPPDNVQEAYDHTNTLKAPKMIRVWVNKKYPEVLGHEF